MKAIIIFIFAVSLTMFMTGCSKLFPDDNFTLKRVYYSGSEIRIDGFWGYAGKIKP